MREDANRRRCVYRNAARLGRRGDRIRMVSAAVQESVIGTKRTFAAPQHFVRFWTKADKDVRAPGDCKDGLLARDDLSANDLGCVKTLPTVVSTQKKNRTCRLGESFMRQRHSV